ncbi:unnamed protein product [Brassicogethes aeneus]|uniref:THAP-type domain-containing protein n=1 Tax=Brassicogethes aeneus TaxID=1431903 RepID=A0A9P0B493_BRAAE|nr:unnamed protein product [Brassicogethes aeneus]
MVKSCKICKQPFTKSSTFSFHTIPKIPELRRRWLLALDLQDSVAMSSAIICSKHFEGSDYLLQSKENSKRQLKKDAIPCLTLQNYSTDPLLEHSYVKKWIDFKKSNHNSAINKNKVSNDEKRYELMRQKYLNSRIEVKLLKQQNQKLEKKVKDLTNIIINLKEKN